MYMKPFKKEKLNLHIKMLIKPRGSRYLITEESGPKSYVIHLYMYYMYIYIVFEPFQSITFTEVPGASVKTPRKSKGLCGAERGITTCAVWAQQRRIPMGSPQNSTLRINGFKSV